MTFRDNEFVAILGPSGSGKTTMLNIVGGLDHCDSGNLVIDQVSTKEYTDRDWDTYRNNRIGFVFQNYNLIPHQSVLANVELALTLSGVSKAERSERARQALEQVDLLEHIHKLPNQLSGGQMQRVAIARALINDPEILLADEPTGALDSKTGVHVMNLLQGIAKERLVIMVTHNPELAAEYATRTISLRDGKVVNDTNPYRQPKKGRDAKEAHRTAMSFLTAIALSFKNLLTKKGRTLMTSFAGSIGITGIAAILALTNGVNAYIRGVEENTLSLYPLSISTQGIDLSSMLSMGSTISQGAAEKGDADLYEVKMISKMFEEVGSNDLESLKTYLDSPESDIDSYVKAIQYNYNITPQIFSKAQADTVKQVNPNNMFSSLGFSGDSPSSMMSMGMTANVFSSLPDDLSLLEGQYDILAGHWPESSHECILVVTESGGISDFVLYAMGLRDPAELDKMIEDMAENNPVTVPTDRKVFSYEHLLKVTFSVVNAVNFYEYDETYEVWADRRNDDEWMKKAVQSGETLKVVGIVRFNPNATAQMLRPGLYYPTSLVYHLMDQAGDSAIVNEQLDSPDVNVFSGKTFAYEAENPAMADFDFSSMLNVDPNAITDMFAMDFSGMTMPKMDNLSNLGSTMDMSSMSGKMPPMDLSAILSDVDIKMDPDALEALITQTMTDYLSDTLLGTAPPTASPGIPQIPTEFSTQIPTSPPTSLPTSWPTLPTEVPTINQTESESRGPGSEPSPEAVASVPSETPESPAETAIQLPTSMPTEFPTSVPSGIPTGPPTGMVPDESFAEWFTQPGVQAQFMQRLVNVINTEEISQQVSASIAESMQAAMQSIVTDMMTRLQSELALALRATMTQMTNQMSDAMNFDPDTMSEIFKFDMDPEKLTGLMMSMMSNQSNSLDANLRQLGYANMDIPYSIDIYPLDFASKEKVLTILDGYNDHMNSLGKEDQVITYTDIVATLMTSVTDIIDKISTILVVFVSISLVVSSIMIGVITFISVLERRKEIGILRALGASKRDIGNVFNAETLIVGFVAGLMGVLITLLLTLIVNPIFYLFTDVYRIARLPLNAALILIGVSMLLTFLAGLIPSSAASRKDPVEALRSE
jgi:ABC-type lipoprotein export system ATPase subunit